jgi:hypothetical protein
MRRRRLHDALRVLVHGEVEHLHERHRARAIEARRKSTRWRRARGIQGFGIAERVKKGRKTREVVLRVYVTRKRPRRDLEHPVPRTVAVPGIGRRIPTDVIEIGRLRPQGYLTRERPIFPGLGVSHGQGPNGTLACLVRHPEDGTLYILGNMHILGPPGRAKKGDDIFQPSMENHGGPDDVVARLEAWLPLTYSATTYPNVADAAIARVVNPADVVMAVAEIGGPTGISADIAPNMTVQKVGSMSGRTTGTVVDPYFSAELPYGGKRAGFRDQVLCTRFTVDGDSGALVLNMQREAVGLHFAGSDTVSVFTRLGVVLQKLGVELVTA